MRYILIENSKSPHEEGLLALTKVLKALGHQVTIFLSAQQVRQGVFLGVDQYADEVHGLRRGLGIIEILRYRAASDVVIYNTTSVRTSVFTLLTSLGLGRNVYYIRNANSWLSYSAHFTAVKDYLPRWISTTIKKLLLSRAHFVVVEFSRIKVYLASRGVCRTDVVPFKLYAPRAVRPQHPGRVHFVVPGAIDFRTKNIELLIHALLQLPENVRERIKITLLGRTTSAVEVAACAEWQRVLGDALVYYKSFVSVPDFTEAFEGADVVLSCFNIQHRCAYLNETYGLSRGSGVAAHAFARALPLVVNEGFKIDDEYAPATRTFQDERELAEIYRELAMMPEALEQLKAKAEGAAKQYSLEKVIARLSYMNGGV